jgi:hypothetical protein
MRARVRKIKMMVLKVETSLKASPQKMKGKVQSRMKTGMGGVSLRVRLRMIRKEGKIMAREVKALKKVMMGRRALRTIRALQKKSLLNSQIKREVFD